MFEITSLGGQIMWNPPVLLVKSPIFAGELHIKTTAPSAAAAATGWSKLLDGKEKRYVERVILFYGLNRDAV